MRRKRRMSCDMFISSSSSRILIFKKEYDMFFLEYSYLRKSMRLGGR